MENALLDISFTQMLKPFNNKLNEHVCHINSSLRRVTDGELLNASQFRKSPNFLHLLKLAFHSGGTPMNAQSLGLVILAVHSFQNPKHPTCVFCMCECLFLISYIHVGSGL